MMGRQGFRVIGALKWSLAAMLGLALVACGGGGGGGGSDSGQTTTLKATMTGEQEVPPVTTGAVGTSTLALEMPSGQLSGSLTVDGMTANAAHVHVGEAGVAGPIIVPLVETTPGTWSVPANTTLTAAQADAFVAGRLYVNAHSTAHPNGEIRGQIGRDVFVVALSPAQEVPPTASTASGTATVSVDPATNKIDTRLTVSGITANAAHIHTGAVGVSGPIIVPLSETAAGSGIWMAPPSTSLSLAQVASLAAGDLYVNAHSLAFPNGEIRGQLGRLVGLASLSGAQEVPPTPSTATGTGTLVINPATREASGAITLSGIAATAAHVHQGAVGVSGPIIVPLASSVPNTWTVPAGSRLTADQFLAFKQGNLYYNAHSLPFPNGEIRGQVQVR